MADLNSHPRSKVTWLTNLPAPYRLGIWNRFQKFHDLSVWYLLSERNWRHWSIDKVPEWQYSFLNKKSLRIGELDLVVSALGNKKVLKDTDVLIVGGWDSPFFIQVMRNAKKKDIPIILFYESTLQSHRFNGRLIRAIRYKIFSLADHVVTAGAASTAAVIDMGIDPKKILTLFNPVDVSWFAEFAASHRVEASTGHRFLYVGQLIDRKNVDALIDAFAAMRQENDLLTIVGDGTRGSDLKKQVMELGLEHAICFTGHHDQEQVAEDYAAAETLVLPSTNEVWGLVVNEALASGLHVVVSSAAGVSAFVASMKGAYVCEPTDVDLALALTQSRTDWQGPITNPEIVEYTPERFADAVLECANVILESGKERKE